MAKRKPRLPAQARGQGLDRLDVHVLGGTAARADGVVVSHLLDLEAGDTVTEPNLLQQPRLGEIGQDPVDGGTIHLPGALTEPLPDVLGAEMSTPGTSDNREDGEPLRRGAKPGGADRLPGRRLAAARRVRGG